jgi:ubiquinone/menaquinone biosynthesis C-methylase UbiE
MDRLATAKRDYRWNFEAFTRDAWVKEWAARMPNGSRVLDAGAGASKYRPYFAHCDYETQDFCQYEGGLVKYKEPINYVCDIVNIPLPDRSLDAIVCTEVIEHVVDPMATVKEFARLLKPGGKLLLTSPLLSGLHMEPYHFYGGFTRYWYLYWLPRVGFSIEEIKPVGGPSRTCTVFMQAFYGAWAKQEKTLPIVGRFLSKIARAFAKIPAHFIFPRLSPKIDSRLGGETICSGYLVAATRNQPNVIEER